MINPDLTAALANEHRVDLMKEASMYRQAQMARITRSEAVGPLLLTRRLVALAKGAWIHKSLPDPCLPLGVVSGVANRR
jgi:hypothetical protein